MEEQTPKSPDARQLAAELLFRSRIGGPFVADLFDELAETSGLDGRDRHLAFELACGVIRHRRTLDCVLGLFSSRSLLKMPPALRLLLRLGAYQLLFLERVPDHAAVDQTVELSKQWASRRIRKHPASIGGFVNAVLRAVAGAKKDVGGVRGQDPRRLIERPGAAGGTLLDRDAFPSPEQSPAQYLADAYSFDPWLADRWVNRWGLDRARGVARAQNRRPGLTLRVNRLRGQPDEIAAQLAEEGVTTTAIEGTALLRVRAGDALNSAAMARGLVQPQDPWTWRIVEQLDLRAGMTVLDRCAAPGVKTTQMAESMGNRGRILAVDQAADGLALVRANCQRLGCRIVTALLADNMPEQLLEIGEADAALVDVPCSNSGVLARRPEARWRIGPDSLARLARLQRDLLMDALNWLAVNRRCVYSTCSLEPEENEQVVQSAIARRQGQVRLVRDKLTLPSLHDDHDGGYWAVIERVR